MQGFSRQQIYPDVVWQEKCIPELESFYDQYMLPELLGQYV